MQKSFLFYSRNIMVLSVRSQIRQVTERFIHQSGLFEICHDAGYGMDKFFSFRFEIQLYEKIQNQKNQTPIIFYWRVTGFFK